MSDNQAGKDSTVTAEDDESSRREDAPTWRAIPRSRLLPAVAGLGVLAVSQPLLDLLGRQPQFLVAHRLAPLEVVLLGVAVVLVPLAVFAVLALSVRRRWWSGAALAVPVLLILLHVGTRLQQEGWPLVLAASALSAVVAFLYLRHIPIQDLLRYLLVVPVAVLFYFFLLVPRAVLAGGDPSGDALALDVMNPVPVVLVVFDEFPLASLIDGRGELLAEQFPSFGRLARDGVWYRNAITVETRTTESIPAILSGSRVPDGLVPNASEHPKTVFRVLGESHDVDGVEPVTALCPEYLCTGASPAGGPLRRWARLITDLAVVYGHLVVPSPWAGRLPPIDENWTGFAAATTADSLDQEWDLMEAVGEAVEADRRADVSRFLAGLEATTGQPLLRVAHLVLPHRPWEFLPDGTRHGQEGVEGYGGRGWGSDEFFVAQGWKRHLLQAGYADSVVGSILQRLDQAGLYESSLVVVVADHGVHFRPGVEDMRVTNRESVGSILPVPLFVKYPAGTDDAPPAGTIDDRRVETIDVAPTVFDVVAVDPGIDVDGRSLLGDHTRSESVLELRGEPFRVDARGLEKLAVAREKERWFPDGDPWALVPRPDIRSLIGRSLPTEDGAGVDVSITSQDPLPPLVEGRIDSTRALSGDELVGLTADGELVAATKVFGVEGGRARFSFLVDPEGEHRPPYRVWLLADGELVG